MENKIQSYQTTDLCLTAYLRCNGVTIVTTEKLNNQTIFFLTDTPNRKQLIIDYFNNSSINVLDYNNMIHDLKRLIHST